MAILENKKIYFDYEILEKLEAGIELLGTEVKSLRSGKGSIVGSYIIVRGARSIRIRHGHPRVSGKERASRI